MVWCRGTMGRPINGTKKENGAPDKWDKKKKMGTIASPHIIPETQQNGVADSYRRFETKVCSGCKTESLPEGRKSCVFMVS